MCGRGARTSNGVLSDEEFHDLPGSRSGPPPPSENQEENCFRNREVMGSDRSFPSRSIGWCVDPLPKHIRQNTRYI